MYYSFKLDKLPVIQGFYTVSRTTVWQIADTHNILIFISDGRCRVSCDGESFVLKKGDVFFIPANTFYSREPIDDILCTMYYIHFDIAYEITSYNFSEIRNTITASKEELDTELLSGETTNYPDMVYLESKVSGIDFDTAKKLFSGINLFSTNRQLMCNIQSQINLCSILSRLSQKTIDNVLTNANLKNALVIPDNLKKAISYIVRHSYEQITLDDLAHHCNISKQQLIRYFKKSFGTTPVNYITEHKLGRAKELLFNQPTLTIKEIAEELGFNNQYYFTRVFTKTTGETPSAYRYRTVNYGKLVKDKN